MPELAPTLAVIGGGQLARMMAQPAIAMALPLRLLAEADRLRNHLDDEAGEPNAVRAGNSQPADAVGSP